MKKTSKKLSKVRNVSENFQKTANATSQQLLKWSRNSGEQVAANFSRIPQSEKHTRGSKNKSENQKCVQTASNKNQQTHKNIRNVTETLANWWPPMCPEFRHPKKSKRPPKMLQNTFDVQEFFQETCKKLLEIFHFVPLIFHAGDTEQQCHAALDALQFHSANPEWWLIPTVPLPPFWGGFETTANRQLHATQTRFVLFMSHEFNTKADTT